MVFLKNCENDLDSYPKRLTISHLKQSSACFLAFEFVISVDYIAILMRFFYKQTSEYIYFPDKHPTSF